MMVKFKSFIEKLYGDMAFRTHFWLRIAVFNLVVVAVLGTLMRYKIGFEFPFFSQKNLQHAHSHFAFLAWVGHALYTLIIHTLIDSGTPVNSKRYNALILSHLLIAVGMLFSFAASGYSSLSIVLSTSSIIIGYVMAGFLLSDLNRSTLSPGSTKHWFQTGLILQIISSFGTWFLAYMMATKQVVQEWYLSSVYFYLHFQYNGWFFFAIMGLLAWQLQRMTGPHRFYPWIFWLFALSSVPSYLLSVLWLPLPGWSYFFVVTPALAQVTGWVLFLMLIKKAMPVIKNRLTPLMRFIWLGVLLAMTVKLALQLGSTHPDISQLAFGFRNIVIAYLHLVLLGFTTLGILAYAYQFLDWRPSKMAIAALTSFAFGILLNEGILLIQGLASFSYSLVPWANTALFAVSVLMMLSAIGIAWFMKSTRPTP
jgi:hypothetical protein